MSRKPQTTPEGENPARELLGEVNERIVNVVELRNRFDVHAGYSKESVAATDVVMKLEALRLVLASKLVG